ncbi:hypothetical protein PBCVNEJV1_182L [Paramecium bursaria Chlorella virus NE-JV-1]|nr:hypothetical protein PBCVNEJV1_182L [Paramecium bursaria Chlorella virus NE-JV-1]
MSCQSRLTLYGVISIVIGILANRFGNYTMITYDISKKESYKHVSIAAFSIGVVLIAYGIASIILKDNIAMCELSKL